MQPERQAVIFDFDYTLADPTRGTVACINYALDDLGFPPTSADIIHQAISGSLEATFLPLVGSEQSHHFEAFLQLFVEHADEVMPAQTHLFESVPETIERLTQQGVALGIVSMKYRPHIEPVLQRENLLDAFEIIIGGDDVSEPKPHPEGVRAAQQALRSSSANTLYVGDSLIDARTAQAAGLRFVAVLSRAHAPDAFDGHAVHTFIADVSELTM